MLQQSIYKLKVSHSHDSCRSVNSYWVSLETASIVVGGPEVQDLGHTVYINTYTTYIAIALWTTAKIYILCWFIPGVLDYSVYVAFRLNTVPLRLYTKFFIRHAPFCYCLSTGRQAHDWISQAFPSILRVVKDLRTSLPSSTLASFP